MKIIFYVFLSFIFLYFAGLWGDTFVSPYKPDEICVIPDVLIKYTQWGWNNYFQWFVSEENTVCRFQVAVVCFYYLMCLPLYTLMKIYGAAKWPVSLSKKFITAEFVLYMALYLYFLFNVSGFVLTPASFFNALGGMLLFFIPFFAYAALIVYVYNEYKKPIKGKSINRKIFTRNLPHTSQIL